MTKRTLDRIALLERLFAPIVQLSFAAPVPDLSLEEWEQVAMRQQALLINTGRDDIDRAAARDAAEDVGKAPPKSQRKLKTAPEFVRHPSVFDTPARA